MNTQKLFKASLIIPVATASVLSGIPVNAEEQELIPSEQASPELIITELMVNPNNIGKNDAYEYIEIYNNSDSPINLNDYKVIYSNLDNNGIYNWDFAKKEQIIEPCKSVVVWIQNKNITTQPTLEDFNSNYGSTLTEDQMNIISSGGMANTNNVKVAIANSTTSEIVSSVSYIPNDVLAHTGIHYKIDGTKLNVEAGSPGSVSEEQIGTTPTVPTEPEDPTNPTTPDTAQPELPTDPTEQGPTQPEETTADIVKITHTASDVEGSEDFKPSVAIQTNENITSAFIHYRNLTEGTWSKGELKLNLATGEYEALIPSSELVSETIYYKFSFKNENDRTIESEIYSSKVNGITFDPTKAPVLLVTEVVPDTSNVTGSTSDGYEFIEIYNNSNEAINMDGYTIRYRYPEKDNKPDAIWNPVKRDVIIKPGETLVYWIKNANNQDFTLVDFNNFYNTNYDENKVIQIHSDGMANGSQRGIIIATNSGEEISAAYYNDKQNVDDVDPDMGVNYAHPQNGTINQIKYDYAETKASPGVVKDIQVPNTKVTIPGSTDTEQNPTEPEVPITKNTVTFTHIPAEIDAKSDLKPTVAIQTNDKIASGFIYYRSLSEGTWSKRQLKFNVATGQYEALIPSLEIVSEYIYYKFEFIGENKTYESDIYSSKVNGITFDPTNAPALLVTEVVPDTDNIGGSDGYEFIEIYNNSTKDINMKDYTIRYRYPMEGSEADLIWNPTKRDSILKTGETLVYWIKNAKNQDKTIADFNIYYGTNYDENKVIEIHSDGMANGSHRGIVIATNTGKEISAAYYFDQPNVDDVDANEGINYTYPQNGTINQIKYDYAETKASPGIVNNIQVPASKVTMPADQKEPIISDQTVNEMVAHGENASLKFSITDDTSVKSVRLYYKIDGMADYKVVDLQESNKDFYEYSIYNPELLNKEKIEYYVEVSDGIHIVTTDVSTLLIEKAQLKQEGFNIESGAVVSKTVSVKAYDKTSKIFINGKDVTTLTKKAIPDTAYFAFDVKKTNVFFKNGVTMGDEILYIFDDTINLYTTLSVPISADHFIGNSALTLSLRAGTKVSPFDTESEENRDDFYMKNPRLVLSDGTIIQDENYKNPSKEYTVGDGGTATPVYNFAFNIPEEAYTALQYNWDTTTLPDREYKLKTGEHEVTVKVDNTAPSITPSINGESITEEALKGEIVLDATIIDQNGVNEVEVLLDGKEIKLPYKASSAELSSGGHTLEVKAIDAGGNVGTITTTFTVVNEIPGAPVLVQPNGKANSANSAKLEVMVNDPTNDELKVSFFEGKTIESNDAEMSMYENSSETEPPATQIVDGETQIQNRSALSMADGVYVETNSKTKFPYHRFNVAVGKDLTEADEIVIHWEGKSLAGRKVSMYIWNYSVNKWELQTFQIPKDGNNFTLKGTVQASEEYVKNGEIQVIIQDEVSKDALADYSLIWMSDTQYYSESYPYIYDSMTQWVKDNKDTLNIKYVFHTGDLVDQAEQQYQWENADKSMKTLEEAAIPYGVLAGNHDVGHKTGDYNAYSQYFGEDRFKNQITYGESYKDNRGHFDLVSANGNDFIMVYMGWGVNEEDIAWMNKVLAENPNRIAILNFHEYLLVSGNRSPIGNEIYEKVVKKNPNVVAVLSGHYHDAETLVDEIDDNGDGQADRKVYQMLADYQGGPEGGSGYLRILKVNQATNKISVQTYSPYLDDYNYYDVEDYPGKDELELDVDLAPKEKMVATDFIKVDVFKDEQIGSTVTSNNESNVSVVWNGLKPKTEYGFYVTVKDDFGGTVRSDLWSFQTLEGSGSLNSGDPGSDKGSSGDSGSGSGLGSSSGLSSNKGSTSNSNKQPNNNNTNPNNNSKPLNAIKLTEEVLNTTSKTIEVIAPKQEKPNLPVEFTFTEALLQKALTEGKEIKLIQQNEVEILIDSNTIKQLVSKNGEIKLSVSDVPTSSIKSLEGQAYSSIIDIDITANKGSVLLEDGLKIKLPLKIENPNQVYTGSYFNEKTNNWEYAGGKAQDGNWVIDATKPGTYTVSSANVKFEDISNHWAKDDISTLAAKRIINGKSDKEFAPNATLTRQQFTLMLVRSLQLPLSDYEGVFKDVVDANSIDTLQLEAAKRFGITTGRENGEFNPNEVITREQMMTMLGRAIELKKPELMKTSNAKPFKDNEEISDYARKYIDIVSSLDFVTGREDGSLNPKEKSMRSHAAKIVNRFVDTLEKE